MNCNSEGFIKINYEKCQVLSEFNINKFFFYSHYIKFKHKEQVIQVFFAQITL